MVILWLQHQVEFAFLNVPQRTVNMLQDNT